MEEIVQKLNDAGMPMPYSLLSDDKTKKMDFNEVGKMMNSMFDILNSEPTNFETPLEISKSKIENSAKQVIKTRRSKKK